MASLSTGKNGNQKGLHRIYYKAADGRRQILYLGRCPVKKAEGVERCVSDLERCRVDGSIPGPATTHWLAGISAELHAKLAKHGLTQPRVSVAVTEVPVVTLDELLERYKNRPKWRAKKESGQKAAESTFTHLIGYYGGARDILSITETDAEDLAGYLVEPKPLGAGLAEATAAGIINAGSALMRFATRSRLVPFNPFQEIRRGSYATAHKAFVKADTITLVIDLCPARRCVCCSL